MLKFDRWLSIVVTVPLLLAGALLVGCGDDGASDSVAPKPPAPATAPVAAPETPIEPATAPATKPIASFMHINNRLVMFPLAKMKLTDDGARVIALLYSDDPPEAIKDSYTGNSFYLQMVLDIDSPQQLSTAIWSHKSRSQEREDSPFGIYLGGRKIQLQPYRVQANFEQNDAATATVRVEGQFLLWNDADSTGLPQSVLVSAEIPVTIETEGGSRR